MDAFLRSYEQLSHALEAELLFKRAFIVACGSFFERSICGELENLAERHGDVRLTTFLKCRALDRKYHEMFDWKEPNANRFWSFFGLEFKNAVIKRLKSNEDEARCVSSFMNLGRMRNLVAHEFLTAPVESTLDELEHEFNNAIGFLRLIRVLLEPPPEQ